MDPQNLRADNKIALTVDEAAHRLSLPKRRVYDLIRERELAAFREGKRLIVPIWSVDTWLRNRMINAGWADHLPESGQTE